MPTIHFTLNGNPTAASYQPGMHFLEVLRKECGIRSAKDGCAPEGTCGCCAILVDGQPVLACRRKPEQMEHRTVVTLEGLSEELPRVLSGYFALKGGVEWGSCIRGFLTGASPFINKKPTPD